jgi:hypothetical protein
MKLAWLCYTNGYDLDEQEIIIKFEEPESWQYAKIVPIVYAEIVK